MARPQFFLVSGPNGAGKSTLTLSIRNRYPNVIVIDPDAIAKEITGSFQTVEQAQVAAGKNTLNTIKDCISNKTSFLVESTISGSTYLKYAKRASAAGFRTTFVFLGLESPQLSSERVSERVGLGGHNIPGEDIQRRYPRSLANLKDYIAAFESAHIYDNSDHYRWVAGYRDGMIHKVSSNIPGWLRHYLPHLNL